MTWVTPKRKGQYRGFTLIELLVVIAIIGVLSSVVLASLQETRLKARDARRISDMEQIRLALAFYFDENEQYPVRTADSCCNGWDQGPCAGDPTFIADLEVGDFITPVPIDPSPHSSDTSCSGYNYFQYNAGSYGCDPSRGRFYVLGIRNTEASGRPHPESPGWSCPRRDWQNEFDWVTGNFEN